MNGKSQQLHSISVLGRWRIEGVTSFLLPVYSSNFSISEPWYLSLLHTDLKQTGERRTWSDCDALKHVLKLGVYLLLNKTTRHRPLNMCIYLHLYCLGEKKKKKSLSLVCKLGIYESCPNSALQPKLSVYKQTPQQQQCRFPACLNLDIWKGSIME